MSAHYDCPVCGEKIERDLTALNRHADEHIVQEIKKSHPAWVTKDGYCPACLEYFKGQIHPEGASTGLPTPNIMPAGARQRQRLAFFCFVVAGAAVLALKSRQLSPKIEVLLFVPLFCGFVCWMQSRERVCVVLAHQGKKETASGFEKIEDPAVSEPLRGAASRILWLSAALAAVITALAILF